ncbi:hypothetical protein RFI_14388 [Reticulomyxa filosa]|uniref:Uncharacterized protein n=1 Tax=Reticulomyxa filosa TaxID=46433 RepID=X6N9V1_RETFI|nr:hypothetical protein RFI_14388 [Reticulomyxa filosa]|eukprot:ETO22806.1 hypothetical protein RFI_14388 [Reticulomyxa filosa]
MKRIDGLGLAILIESNLLLIFLLSKDTRVRYEKEKMRRLQGSGDEHYFPTTTWYLLVTTFLSALTMINTSIGSKNELILSIVFAGSEMIFWISDWENTVRQTMVFLQVRNNMVKKNPFGRIVIVICGCLQILLFIFSLLTQISCSNNASQKCNLGKLLHNRVPAITWQWHIVFVHVVDFVGSIILDIQYFWIVVPYCLYNDTNVRPVFQLVYAICRYVSFIIIIAISCHIAIVESNDNSHLYDVVIPILMQLICLGRFVTYTHNRIEPSGCVRQYWGQFTEMFYQHARNKYQERHDGGFCPEF